MAPFSIKIKLMQVGKIERAFQSLKKNRLGFVKSDFSFRIRGRTLDFGDSGLDLLVFLFKLLDV
jgi:hypothetical protein